METMDPAEEICPSQHGPVGGVVALGVNQEWKSSPCELGMSQSVFPSAVTIKLLQHLVHKALG